MKNLENLEAVTHTHKTFYRNENISNAIRSEAVLGYFFKFNKYKIKIEML